MKITEAWLQCTQSCHLPHHLGFYFVDLEGKTKGRRMLWIEIQRSPLELTSPIAVCNILFYALPGCRFYFFKRGAGVETLAGGTAPTPPLNQNLWAGAVYLNIPAFIFQSYFLQ
jgi:hypothetical protein